MTHPTLFLALHLLAPSDEAAAEASTATDPTLEAGAEAGNEIVDEAPEGAADENAPGFLSPGGVLPDDRVAFFVEGDTELPGYPAVILGVRRGAMGWLDYGVEAGGIDTVFVLRAHGKARIWESEDRAFFVGGRLRVEFKHQLQVFSDFPTLDDHGFTVVPEVSVGWRFGEQREHAVYYAAFYYLDIDVRRGHDPQHYLMLGMLGYEHRFAFGLHLFADASFGLEVGNPLTEGIFFPRFRLGVGYAL
jgi:hypothetical protein